MAGTGTEAHEWLNALYDDMVGLAAAPSSAQRRQPTPPALTHPLCDGVQKSRPGHDVFEYIRGASKRQDLTVPVINNANDLIKRVFPLETDAGAADPAMLKSAQAALFMYYRYAQLVHSGLLLVGALPGG
jgi:hypothetical protein